MVHKILTEQQKSIKHAEVYIDFSMRSEEHLSIVSHIR